MRFVTKTIFSLVALQFLLVAAGTLLLFRQSEMELRQDFAKRTESIASSLAVGLQVAICDKNNPVEINRILSKVLAAGELTYLIIRANEKVIASAGETALSLNSFSNSQSIKNELEKSRVFATFAPIDSCESGGKEMEAEVGVDFRVLDHPLSNIFNGQLIALLGQLILSIGLAIFANQIVSRRINSIEATCRRISIGDFGTRAEVKGADEYATIGRALNKTIESLEKLTAETARQRQELATHSKLSSLGEMAGGVAHEINNPLAIISLRADQLEEELRAETLDKEVMLSFVQIIQKTAGRIAGITRGMRLFSRNAENDAKIETSIRTIVEDSTNLCTERFRSSGIELKIDLKAEGKVNVRATQISQVIVNLLNNAYDAVQDSEKKWVELTVEHKGPDQILLTIADSGPGIPAALREKIMQPFFTTKEVGKGTGLGLSISQGIILDHGGQFYLDEKSTHTRFCIELPKIA